MSRCERIDGIRRKLEDQLSERNDDVEREKKIRTDHEKGERKKEIKKWLEWFVARRKMDIEVRHLHEQLAEVNALKHDLEQNVKRWIQIIHQYNNNNVNICSKESEMNGMHSRVDEADSQCQKLHANVRQLMTRNEQLEEMYEQEQRLRQRVCIFRKEIIE